MRRFRSLVPLPIAVLTGLAPTAAQPPASGPQAGQPLAAVRVYAATGPFAGREFDAAAQLGQGPGALLFVHELSRNTAPMIRALDELRVEYGVLGLHAFSVLLSGDRTHGEERIRTVSNALHLAQPMVVSVDGAEGPGDYALDRKCTLTLVLIKDGKVQRSTGYTDTGRADAAALRASIESVTGRLPTDEAALRALLGRHLPDDPATLKRQVVELQLRVRRLHEELRRARSRTPRAMQPRRTGAPRGERGDRLGTRPTPRAGRAPEDAELRSLLRRIIDKTADEATLDELFQAVDARIGDDAALATQGLEMFRLIESLGYGTDQARRRARAWIDAHAKKGAAKQPEKGR